jgi:hypothetical protein
MFYWTAWTTGFAFYWDIRHIVLTVIPFLPANAAKPLRVT